MYPKYYEYAVNKQRKLIENIETKEATEQSSNNPIIKSASTPASLQTIVRFQNGSNMSLQHKVIFVHVI